LTIRNELKATLLTLGSDPLDFERLALDIFRYQYHNNVIYQAFVDSVGRKIAEVERIEKIPFLPISFFKTQDVICSGGELHHVFESSGTTGTDVSRHLISDLSLYEANSRRIFEQAYGPLTDYHIFALLPSYLERNTSSLVYMVQNFILNSFSDMAGFYMANVKNMLAKMKKAYKKDNKKILLMGVSFALLDLAEDPVLAAQLSEMADKLIVIETGGMKGRRKEMIREELHMQLKTAFGLKEIHSEYGMTELLSQAYSKGQGTFEMPVSMRIRLREINDPFTYLPHFPVGNAADIEKPKPRTGGINVIDLCNLDSCSFIETQDLGTFTPDYKQIKIMGRFDNSDIRGCNLMVNE
jgi:phenylacetate-coenzyme A ligase PaaK-like adenylate-forming protein